MLKVLLYAGGVVAAAHGLIHLMGFAAYWPLTTFPEIPYKTALLAGRWEVGATGMRVFALLYALAAVGFIACVAGLFLRTGWWSSVMLTVVLFSTGLILLDWAAAFRGAIVNALILAAMALAAALKLPL